MSSIDEQHFGFYTDVAKASHLVRDERAAGRASLGRVHVRDDKHPH
jgi:hypothetical protein